MENAEICDQKAYSSFKMFWKLIAPYTWNQADQEAETIYLYVLPI